MSERGKSERVEVRRIAYGYGRRSVLADISFEVPSGEIAGVIGPNGAGKTTILRILVGLLRPDGGDVLIDGRCEPPGAARPRLAYFAGESTVPSALRAHRWRRLFLGTGRTLEQRAVRLLSRGTRQMVGLQAALGVPAPRVVVLDEPWEGLDPDATRWLNQTLRTRQQAGSAVVVSSHRLHDLADVCTRFIFLDAGRATTLLARDVAANGRLTGEAVLSAFDALRGVS